MSTEQLKTSQNKEIEYYETVSNRSMFFILHFEDREALELQLFINCNFFLIRFFNSLNGSLTQTSILSPAQLLLVMAISNVQFTIFSNFLMILSNNHHNQLSDLSNLTKMILLSFLWTTRTKTMSLWKLKGEQNEKVKREMFLKWKAKFINYNKSFRTSLSWISSVL